MLDSINVAEKRLEIYEFLSYSYLNIPSNELLDLIQKSSNDLRNLTGTSLDFMEGKDIDYFIQEYYDRFFVPTSKLFVPPYESAIRNKKNKKGKVVYGKLDSEETFHVKACYEMVDFKVEELNGFKPLKENHFPDHIAFEMSFLTYLISLEKSSLEKEDNLRARQWRKLQKDFLADHISKWIREYARLSNEKGVGLYSYLSNIAANWTDMDLEYLIEENL